jgi:hypothetical protein
MKEELRLYSFVNFYLSSIQQGIQTGHLAVDLVKKYLYTAETKHLVQHQLTNVWAEEHKTFIVLNGGDDKEVRRILDQLYNLCSVLELPYCYFLEPGLGSIVTCCGVIVPERYFNAKRSFAPIDTGGSVEMGFEYKGEEETIIFPPGTPRYNFIELIKSKPLAK